MILRNKINYKVQPNTRSYYNSLGYNCKNYDIIEINVFDLPKTSGIKIDVKCDSCNKEKNLAYKHYLKNTKDNTIIYTCSACSNFKVKKTKLEKYGDENYQNTEKIKKTKLEKYGDENFTGREKAKITCLNKYGVDNVSKSDIIKKLKKETNNTNWGVDNVFQSQEIKEKISITIGKKYGVNHYIKSDDIKEKYKKFCNKLNVEHYSQTEEYKKKFEETNLLKFGFKTNLMSPFIKDKIKETNLIKYGFIHPMNNKKISDKNVMSLIRGRYYHFYNLGYMVKDYDIEKVEYILERMECGHIFNINYDLFRSRIKYNNNSCLICHPKDPLQSIKEQELGNWLNIFDTNMTFGNRKLLNGKEIDLYLPDKKLAIEFNGLYWHSDKFKDKFYHLNKTVACNELGISLLHIWEDDWLNKKEIVKSIILNKIGLITNKIFARKCKIKVITNKESNLFLDNNHIQGGTNASTCISLYYNEEIVSVMTFGKRRLNNKDTFELIRFCNKINTNVIGGATKLFSYFLKNYKFENMISYSDKSLFDGGLYSKLGFKNDGDTSLNYYWTDLSKKYHRFNFNKKKLIKLGYDKNKTEDEIMKEIGYYKIWSCGQIRWIFE
jgi:very-short-patch-repair endonuclease